MITLRHWFKIDREWVERREAILRAEEDAAIRAARDEASGEDRALLDALLDLRRENAQREAVVEPDYRAGCGRCSTARLWTP